MARDGIANIVHALQTRGFDPRRVGTDAWDSRCPAHCGTDHALSVRRNDSNQVLLECRSPQNCRFEAIIRALRLGYDTLYDETPDWVISQLRDVPIQPAPASGSQAHEKNEPGPSAVEAANGSAQTTLPPEQKVGADAGAPASGRAAAESSLQPLLQAPAEVTIPPQAGTAAEATRSGDFPELDPAEALIIPAAPLEASWPAGARSPWEEAPDDFADVPMLDPALSDHYREKVARMSSVRMLSWIASAARLLRSPDGQFCAQVRVGDRREIFALKSLAFHHWLIDGYMSYRPDPPGSGTIRRVVGMLEARARFYAGMPEYFVRVGHDGRDDEPTYFLDLGDPSGQAVAIRAGGWQVVDQPDVYFKRPGGLLPLPTPVHGGSIELLRPFVNLSEAEFRLLIVWLTAALRPVGPYAILMINADQDSGKTTLARMLRLLIDPQAGPLVGLPESARDMMATAVNGWLLVYDNISTIPVSLSDCLCRLAFGGGHASRALYTNDERSVIYAERPVLLSGIDSFAVRADLRDRGACLHPPTIVRSERRTNSAIWRSFRAAYPQILGGLLDAMAGGLREQPSVKLAELPRMADFAEWGEAVSRGLGWGAGTFVSLYDENRKLATEVVLEESPVADILLAAARSEPSLTAPASELHARLTRNAGKRIANSAGWPKTPTTFARELRRLAPQFRLHGLCMTFERRKDGQYVTLHWEPGPTSQA